MTEPRDIFPQRPPRFWFMTANLMDSTLGDPCKFNVS